MAKITAFDKKNLPALRAAIDKALASVEAEFGVKLDLGRISFQADSFKGDLSGMIGNSDPDIEGVPTQNITNLQKQKGKDAFKRIVKIMGEDAMILGLHGSGFLFRFAAGTNGAKKYPGVKKMAYKYFDKLDCQVRNIPYNSALDTTPRR